MAGTGEGSASIITRWIPMSPSTQRLVLVGAGSCALTIAAVLSTQHLHRIHNRRKLRDQVEKRARPTKGNRSTTEQSQYSLQSSPKPPLNPDDLNDDDLAEEDELTDFTRPPNAQPNSRAPAQLWKQRQVSPVIINEALARNYVFFSEQGMHKIRNSFVVIVGLGGVGSAAALMLVRSGVKKVRLIDFDQVSLSSLNRHATATLSDVGTPKVLACATAFNAIAPWVEVDARVALYSKEEAAELLADSPDYVIDCIDNIDSKVDLLAYCHHAGIKVFSSLGAGAKSDPSRIQVSDISSTFEDPLARSVRRRLKLAGVQSGVPVVYSTEKPRSDIALLPLPEDEFKKGSVDELSALSNFRVRILPVLGPLPAMFGNAAAAYVLQDIAGFKMEPLPVKNRSKMAATIHRQLSNAQYKFTGDNRLQLTEDDVLYLFEEVHRARSVAPPMYLPSRPCLLPWSLDDPPQLASTTMSPSSSMMTEAAQAVSNSSTSSPWTRWDNLVVFDRDEGLVHETRVLQGGERAEDVWGQDVSRLVHSRMEEERRVRRFRA